MPLTPAASRDLLHTRSITTNGYARPGGLYDLEGHLRDTKTYTWDAQSGRRAAGEPIHDMWLRITVDETLTIVDAEACFDAVPYPGHCEQIAPDYACLKGLRIAPGFTATVRSLLSGTQGCTHVTEMIGVLATVAFQTMAKRRTQDTEEGARPFQLNRCHALATTGPVVAQYYPRWAETRTAPQARKESSD